MLNDARTRGFEVRFFFIGISSPELSHARVRERVSSRSSPTAHWFVRPSSRPNGRRPCCAEVSFEAFSSGLLRHGAGRVAEEQWEGGLHPDPAPQDKREFMNMGCWFMKNALH